jgi:copper chaperone CopZ
MELELTASNIKCGGCVQAIRDGLRELATSVDVDIDSGKLSLSGEQLDEATIRNKLAELGYPAVD